MKRRTPKVELKKTKTQKLGSERRAERRKQVKVKVQIMLALTVAVINLKKLRKLKKL